MKNRYGWVKIDAEHTDSALPPRTRLGARWTVDTLYDATIRIPLMLAYDLDIEAGGTSMEHRTSRSWGMR